MQQHFLDIINDEHLLEKESLYLTETHLLPTENTTSIESNLQTYFTSSFIEKQLLFCWFILHQTVLL